MFSCEATGKWSKFRFRETGRQGGIFELYQNKETCTGSDSKNRVSKHEVHKHQRHDEGLPFPTKSIEALKKNVLIWKMCKSSSLKAAIHLGPNYLANLEVCKNTNFDEIQGSFIVTQKLILESEEFLNVRLLHGRGQYCLMIEWSSGQKRKCVSTHIPFYAWESWMAAKMQLQDGKVKWENSPCPFLTKNCWESMENQLNSSGILSQDFRHYRFFRKSRMICENVTSNLSNSQTGSSSCQCSTISIGQEKEMVELVFRFQKKARHTRKDSCRDTGRVSVLETKRSGMELFFTPEGKWDSTATQNGGTIQRFRSSSIEEYQCSESCNPEKENNGDTIHFNADASNTELLFRFIL